MWQKYYSKKNYDCLSPIEVYQMVLTRQIKTFPNNVWDQPDSKEYAAVIIRYLIEEILKWSTDDLKKNLSQKTFDMNHLGGMMDALFNACPYKAIDLAYPGRFKAWELPSVPKNFWNIETGIQAVRWLFEEKLKWSDEEIIKNIRVRTFTENNLRSMLRSLFNDSPYQAINAAYPGRFKIEDFKIWKRKSEG